MKRKVNKKNFTEVDNFERKSKKHPVKRDKGSKRKLSIYDEFEDEDMIDYSLNRHNDFEEDEDTDD